MRKHGISARRNSRPNEIEAERVIVQAMWQARILRAIRSGACFVTGAHGELLVLNSVSLSGYDVTAYELPHRFLPELSKRLGRDWMAKADRHADVLREVLG